jgi:hypothetical protein
MVLNQLLLNSLDDNNFQGFKNVVLFIILYNTNPLTC